MEYQIDFISGYIEDRLRHSDKGEVHSVYRKTVNLSGKEGMIALQAKDSPLSPISLASSLSAVKMEELGIHKGDRVIFAQEGLSIIGDTEEYQFSYRGAKRLSLRLSEGLSPSSRKILTNNISLALAGMRTGGFEIIFRQETEEEMPLMLLAARKRIYGCRSLYQKGDAAAAGTELSKLIGLGTGLTPSGDDFLCGVLAGLRISGMEEQAFTCRLKEEIHRHLDDTIDISAAFLSCALEGQFSLAVNQLYNVPSPEKIMSDFQKIGHSSGADTLCGMLFALQLKG